MMKITNKTLREIADDVLEVLYAEGDRVAIASLVGELKSMGWNDLTSSIEYWDGGACKRKFAGPVDMLEFAGFRIEQDLVNDSAVRTYVTI